MTPPSLLACRAVVVGRLRALRGRSEHGSSIVEFVFLSTLMLIPLVYLVLMLARIQAGSYAASAAAREAGRAFVTAAGEEVAAPRAEAAARLAFEDQGFAETGRLDLACDGSPCLRPDAQVAVTATVTVPLPLIPSFARSVIPLAIPVTASHVSTVDRFRGER